MTTLTIPSSVPLAAICEALRLAGLEPDPRHHRGTVAFRPITVHVLTTPQERIRAAARRAEVRT
jgi:hypothetical protein